MNTKDFSSLRDNHTRGKVVSWEVEDISNEIDF